IVTLCLLTSAAVQDAPAAGFQAEVKVRRATGFDWSFVASGFGEKEAKELEGFDSRQQRFQLFVPRNYKADRAWPLVVFVSPGDAPMGWRSWQKVCESQGILYCEAYRAGN